MNCNLTETPLYFLVKHEWKLIKQLRNCDVNRKKQERGFFPSEFRENARNFFSFFFCFFFQQIELTGNCIAKLVTSQDSWREMGELSRAFFKFISFGTDSRIKKISISFSLLIFVHVEYLSNCIGILDNDPSRILLSISLANRISFLCEITMSYIIRVSISKMARIHLRDRAYHSFQKTIQIRRTNEQKKRPNKAEKERT